MRTQQLPVRLSEAEQAELRRRAAVAGVAVSEYVRSRLLGPAEPAAAARAGAVGTEAETWRGGRALLQVRVRPETKAAIRAKAGRAGLSLSAYVRRAALERDVVHRFDQAAVYQLQRIGRNLNQAVKVMHQGHFSEAVRESLRRCLVALEVQLQKTPPR